MAHHTNPRNAKRISGILFLQFDVVYSIVEFHNAQKRVQRFARSERVLVKTLDRQSG